MGTDAGPPLVGRESEVARITTLLETARGGVGSTLLVRGEAGIGKSRLLRAVASAVPPGTLVLRTTGREEEQGLPFAALATFLHPMLDQLASLPPPQSAALRGALALEDPAGVEPFSVAAATLSLVTRAAEHRLLLCVVDDSHWLDAASAGVVMFVAQRLEDVGALLLLAARDGEGWPRGLDALPSLTLAGLDADAGGELLSGDEGLACSAEVARALVQRTNGNPLALLELRLTLPADVLSGRHELADPLPAGDTITALFQRRLQVLPRATREALLRASADSQLMGEDFTALESAERTGIVEVRDGRVQFRHPLMRSAVYHGADEPDRRRAHAELAARIPPGDPSPRRAIHRARAAAGPDETVAAELADSGRKALRRGGVAEGGALLTLAADLSPDPTVRATRRVEAASALFFSGDLLRATAALDLAEQETGDERARIALDRVRGTILLWTGDVRQSYAILVQAAERAVSVEPELAVAIFCDAVWAAMTAARIRDAVAAAHVAAELAQGVGGPTGANVRALTLRVQVIAGEAGPRAAAANTLRAAIASDAPMDPIVAGYGLTFIWIEAFDDAHRVLQEGVRRARATGALPTLPLLLAAQCELATWRGDLRAALVTGGEADLLCAQIGNNVAHPYVLSVLARAEALAGRDVEAKRHARAALEFSRRRGIDSIEIYAACALGALALSEGRYADVLALLDPLRALYAEQGIGEPNAMPWLGDLAEAAILSGDDSRAADVLDLLHDMAEQTGSRWAGGVGARARALRGVPDLQSEISAAAALLHDMPLELARVHLVHGERLRRARRRADARLPLRAALEIFDRTGAQRWAERARRELAAAGEVSEDRSSPPERLLSPQELQVALLVADGLSNRDVAARLIVSPKTVEYHLGNTFRKLGVRSRVGLVRRLGRD